ncbi:Ig-like domain-containing protein, partial [Endozoicomonas sp.]|nr:Ig-like domain-containing protein [Endozoicomonas sp.]
MNSSNDPVIGLLKSSDQPVEVVDSKGNIRLVNVGELLYIDDQLVNNSSGDIIVMLINGQLLTISPSQQQIFGKIILNKETSDLNEEDDSEDQEVALKSADDVSEAGSNTSNNVGQQRSENNETDNKTVSETPEDSRTRKISMVERERKTENNQFEEEIEEEGIEEEGIGIEEEQKNDNNISLAPSSSVPATIPRVLEVGAQSFSVNESVNDDGSIVVGKILSKTQGISGDLTYKIIAGNNDEQFEIDENTGAISVTGDLNHELKPIHNLTIEVSADNGSISKKAAISIAVNDVEEAPETTLDADTTTENTATLLDVLVNDTDEDHSDNPDTFVLLSAEIIGEEDSGTVSVVDNKLSFDPGGNFDQLAVGATETVTVRYIMSDAGGLEATGTAVITITGTNDQPEVSQSLSAASDQNASSYAVDLLEYASDVDVGTQFSVSGGSVIWMSGDARGVMVGDNQLVVQPYMYNNLGVGEQETIVYRYSIEDGDGGMVDQTASITVSGSNDVPTVSSSITQSVSEDSSQIQVDLLEGASDVDDSDTLIIQEGSVTLVSGDASGVVIAGNTLTLNLEPYQYLKVGETNPIEYSYTIEDGNGGFVSQTAMITVTGSNDGPQVESSITQEVEESDSEFTVNLLSGVTDVDDAENLQVTNFSLVSGDGSGARLSGNQLVVTPQDYGALAAGESESLVYEFDVQDGSGATVRQTATITIMGGNTAPEISGEITAETTEGASIFSINLLRNASDTDAGDTLAVQEGSIILISGDDVGISFNKNTVFVDPLGYEYLPEGEQAVVRYSYQVVDSGGATASHSIAITISGSNDQPVVEAVDISGGEDATVTGSFSVSDKDSSDAHAFSILTLPDRGTVTNNNDGTFSFNPDSDFQQLNEGETQQVTFTYAAIDSSGAIDANSETEVVTITITGSNDQPIAEVVTIESIEGGSLVSGSFEVTDHDEGSSHTFSILTQPEAGIVVNNNDGTFSFSPGSGFQSLSEGEAQEVTFTYQAVDNSGASNAVSEPQTVTVRVTGTNDQPEVAAFSLNATDGSSAVIANFEVTDADSADNHTFTILSEPTEGILTNNGDGSFSFDPGNDFGDLSGNETRQVTFTYIAVDNSGSSSSESEVNTVTVVVLGTNSQPVVQDLSLNGTADGSLITGDFVVSDDDTTNLHTFNILNGPAEGSVTNNNDGSFSFNPGSDFQDMAEGETRQISFTYEAVDDSEADNNASEAKTITITVTGTNDQPVAEVVNVDAIESDAVMGSFSVTDSDSTDTHTFSITTQPAEGAVTNNNDGTFSFSPGSNFQSLGEGETRDVTFQYVAIDDSGTDTDTSEPQTVTITVTGTNDKPIAEVVSLSSGDTSAVSGSFVVSDADSNDDHTFSIVTPPATGTVINNNDGTFSFDPGSDFKDLSEGEIREITFTYVADDGSGAENARSDVTTVSITVTGSNDRPVAEVVSIAASEGASPVTGSFAVTDGDTGDNHTFNITRQPSEGTVTNNNDGTFIFVPGDAFEDLGEGEIRDITFEYVAVDDSGTDTDTSEAQTVTITVTGTNDKPQADVVNIETAGGDGLASGSFVVTDADHSDDHSFSIAGQPSSGTVTNNNDGTFSFDPGDDFQDLADGETREVTFTYVATDDSGADNASSDPQTVTITVTGSNARPVVEVVNVSAREGMESITGSFAVVDVDSSDTHSFSISNQPAEGTVTNNNDGTFSFTLGSDFEDLGEGETRDVSFEYIAVDDSGTDTDTSEPQTVTITVTGTNDKPEAEVVSVEVIDGSGVITGNFTVTDSDSNDTHTFTITSQPEAGAVTNNSDGSFSFDPGSDFSYLLSGETREITFNYRVADGSGADNSVSDESTVTLTVTGTNDRPIAEVVAIEAVEEGYDVIGSFGVTDRDNNDTHTYTITKQPSEGVVTNNNDGTFKFAVGNNFQDLGEGETREVTFEYIAIDSSGEENATSEPKTITVTVTGTNDTPQAEVVAVGAGETAVVTGEFLVMDSDSGDSHTFTIQTEPESGTLVNNNDGTFSFDPGDGFRHLSEGEIKELTFTYIATDDSGIANDTSEPQTVTITITGSNERPVVEVLEELTSKENTLSASFSVVDGDSSNSHTFNILTEPDKGTVTNNNDGTFSFDPGPDFDYLGSRDSEEITFTYEAVDDSGASNATSAPQTVTIVVTGNNHQPEAEMVSVDINEDTHSVRGTFGVSDGDEIDTHTFEIRSQPEEGTVVNNEDGTFTFTPNRTFQDLNNGETREVTFSYVAIDDSGTANATSEVQTATVTVQGADEPPETVYLSDLTATDVTNITDLEDDGLQFKNDVRHLGNSLYIDDTYYEKGVYQLPSDNSVSKATYDVPEGTTHFSAILGLGGYGGSVRFSVLLDGVVAYQSGTVTSFSDKIPINVPMHGAREISLQVDSLGSSESDQAIWADAKLIVIPQTNEAPVDIKLDIDASEEFALNQNTIGHQTDPVVTSLDSGGFMTVWTNQTTSSSSGGDGSGYSVKARIFDEAGHPTGSEFFIGTSTSSDQQQASVTTLENGDVLVVWRSAHTGKAQIYGRRFDADGNPQTGEMALLDAVGTGSGIPDVTALSDGGYLAVWKDWSLDGSSQGIYAQRFTVDDFTVAISDLRGETLVFTAGGLSMGSGETASVTVPNDFLSGDHLWVVVAGGGYTKALKVQITDSDNGITFTQTDARYISGNDTSYDFDTQPSSGNNIANSDTSPGYGIASVSMAGNTIVDNYLGTTGQEWIVSDDQSATIGDQDQPVDDEGLGQFKVNTYTAGLQDHPEVVGLSDGGYVIVWQGQGEGQTSNHGVFLHHYNADGSTLHEGVVSTTTSDDQSRAQITALAGGGYVVTWSSDHDGIYNTYGRLYDYSGEAVGDERLLTESDKNQTNDAVVALDDGGFLVSWSEDFDTFAQRFDAQGSAVDEAFRLNDRKGDTQDSVQLDVLNDGRVVAVWESESALQYGSNREVYGKVLALNGLAKDSAANGVSVGKVSVDDPDIGEQHLFELDDDADGRFAIDQATGVITIADADTIDYNENESHDIAVTVTDNFGHSITKTLTIDVAPANHAPNNLSLGMVDSGEFTLNQHDNTPYDPHITALDNGGFITTWVYQVGDAQNGGDGSNFGTKARLFNAYGQPQGDEFVVTQSTDHQLHSSVTTLANGDVLMTWASYHSDSSYRVYGRRFDEESHALSDEFALFESAGAQQSVPDVSALEDGGYVVSWHDASLDGSNNGVFAQRFNADDKGSGQFQVNSYTAGHQDSPDTAGLSDGGYVVVWDGPGQNDTGSDSIYLRQYSSNGETVQEIQVNNTTTGTQDKPQVTALTEGGFLVTWTSSHSGSSAIYGRRYGDDGKPEGVEFQVSQGYGLNEWDSSVLALDEGGFIVSWQAAAQEGVGIEVYAQRYDVNAQAVNDIFRLNDNIGGDQQTPQLTQLADGRIASVWRTQENSDGATWDIRGNVLALDVQVNEGVAAGTPVGQVNVNDPDVGDSHQFELMDDADGRFAIDPNTGIITVVDPGRIDHSDAAQHDIIVKVTDSGGNELSESMTLDVKPTNRAPARMSLESFETEAFQLHDFTEGSQYRPSITGLDNGGFISVWDNSHSSSSTGGDGSGEAIKARLYNEDGQAMGDEFLVNQNTSSVQFYPSVTTLADGDVLVTWSSNHEGSFRVYGRRYDEKGHAQTGDFALFESGDSHQHHSEVSALADGGYIVSWQDKDGSEMGIYAQRFDADNNGLGQVQVNRYTNNDQARPETAGLADGGYAIVWSGRGSDQPSDDGIYIRQYNAKGETVKEDIVNTTLGSSQSKAEITALNSGGYLVSWSSNHEDTYNVYARMYDAQGEPIGDEWKLSPNASGDEWKFSPNASLDEYNTDIIALDDGGFMATWYSNGEGAGNDVYAQRYDAEGGMAGDVFRLNDYIGSDQESAQLTQLADGRIVAAWQSNGQDGDSGGVYGKVLTLGDTVKDDAEVGAVVGQVRIDDPDLGDTHQFALEDDAGGRFAIDANTGVITVVSAEYIDYGDAAEHDVQVRVTDSAGHTLNQTLTVHVAPGNRAPTTLSMGRAESDEFVINESTAGRQDMSAVTALDDGSMMVAWRDAGTGSLKMRRLDAEGEPVSDEIYLADIEGGPGSDPSITTLANGDVLATWSSEASGSYRVYGRRFDEEGNALSDKFELYESSGAGQYQPDITTLSDGGYLAVWQDASQDGSSHGVYAQRFNQNDQGLGQFKVNSHTSGSQETPHATGLIDGGYVVVWNGAGADGQSAGVYLRHYGAKGETIAEMPINQGDSTAVDVQIAALDEGGYVASWSSNQDGTYQIYARLFDAQGQPQGDEFLVNDQPDFDSLNKSILSLNDGGFLMGWTTHGSEGADGELFAQRFDASGAKEGDSFMLNDYIRDHQDGVQLDQLEDGRIISVWDSNGDDGNRFGISGKLFSLEGAVKESAPEGTVVGKIDVDDPDLRDTHHFELLDNAGGRFSINETTGIIRVADPDSINYEDAAHHELSVRVTDSAGYQVTETFTIDVSRGSKPPVSMSLEMDGGEPFALNAFIPGDQTTPVITSLNNGNLLAVWKTTNNSVATGGDGSGGSINARILDANGQPQSPEFRVHRNTTNDQSNPAATTLMNGDVLMTWTSNQSGAYRLYGRRYDEDGNALGLEFSMTESAGNGQYEPSISALKDGGYLVSWHDDSLDGSSLGVFAHRFDADDQGLGQFKVNTYTTNQQYNPDTTGLSDG